MRKNFESTKKKYYTILDYVKFYTNYMKISRTIIYLVFLVFTLTVHADEDSKLTIHWRVSGYGITNTWLVAVGRLEKLPTWNEKTEPPLQVGKAISLAKDWIVSKGGSTNSYVESIEFRSVSPGAPPGSSSKFRPCWFYIIRFYQFYQFGSSATCVVLSDGSIVDPESTPRVKNDLLRYLD
jgi:hypothetical protein